ncbi:hypothetical protein [Weissella bombi]|uniref:Uncharacterized protein n=1 Tax=Weissella bombi TaxID=1505725 RepID=A0A1C3ZR08_9LACO|nr:hypothetical protein [Weissella bombi]SCB84839.1 hypothetical protein GA0061074_102157 [Weissella bombi]
MDVEKIPEDMQDVRDRVALMAGRGFTVSEEDVIKEALKAGFQSIVDEKMDGNYYTVRWDEKFNALQILGMDNELVGSAVPKEDGPDFIKQFEANATNTWYALDKEALKVIGR